jgi:CRISPR-associated protein Cas1
MIPSDPAGSAPTPADSPHGVALLPPPIPFERHLLTLRLATPVTFRFNHGGVLRGLLSAALGEHDLPAGLAPFACESGCVRFEAGDPYRIGLTLAASACGLADRIVEGLKHIGACPSRPGDDAPPTLAGNFTVVSAAAVTPPALDAQFAELRGRTELTLRFVSPFRLERPDALKVPGAAYLNADCFPAGHFLLRLYKRLFFLANGRYPEKDEERRVAETVPTSASATDARGLWIDVPITGPSASRPDRPKGYTLGGLLGTVHLAGLDDVWLRWLLLGRYLHAGEAVHYGFGRYLFCADGLLDEEPFRPARTLLDRAAAVERLNAALDLTLAKSDAPGADRERPDQLAASRHEELPRLARELEARTYVPQPLAGFVVRKGDHVRALAVPTARDRVVQRAAIDVLAPSIDSLLEDCSFAYRKGYSRQTAARAVEQARGQGYRYVLDADISAFFDSVDWKRLLAKLHALLPFEPLVDLVAAWVKAPVSIDGRSIARTRGLPQGAPISPLLANLFLNEFDEEILGEGYRLVRYADDFVVLCRDLEQAREARERARAALAKLGLDLNDEKTSIADEDAGFQYLGYLFCGSVVVESKHQEAGDAKALSPEDVPAASWLAQVPFEKVRDLAGPAVGRGKRLEVVRLQARDTESNVTARPLYVTDPGTRLHLAGDTLVVEKPPQEPMRYPIRELLHVVVCGFPRVTLPLVVRLSQFGVPVYLCRRTGDLVTALVPHAPDWTVWAAQGRLAEDPRARLTFARAVVAAKLHNFAALVTRFRLENAAATASQIRDLERATESSESVDALTGLEGQGAARYFAAMAASLEQGWGFGGRSRNPPADPVNAMLSFGYTMLYHHVTTDLVAAGLNPRIGLYHRPRGTHHALASDLVEEFRPLVDAVVWAMVHRHEVTADGFRPSADGAYPCLMDKEVRRAFIRRVDGRLATSFRDTEGTALSYREAMHRQVRRFRAFATGKAPAYVPFRWERSPGRQGRSALP